MKKKKWPTIVAAVGVILVAMYTAVFISFLGGMKALEDFEIFDIGD